MVATFDPTEWLRGTERVPAALFHADPQGEIQVVNPAWSALTGRDVPGAGNENWLLPLHPEDRDAARAAWTRAQAAGGPFEAEFRIRTRDGLLRWVKAIATPESPPERGYSGVWIDQTALKIRENDLHERLHMLEALIANSTDGIFVKDRQGRYLLANPASQATQIPTLGSPIGKRDEDRFTAETARTLREIDLEVMQTGKPLTAEEALTLPDGTTRIHATSKFPYLSEDGTVLGVMGISRDVTAEKALESRLREHEARLEEAQRMAHLGNWEWNISHDRITWSDELYRIFGLTPETYPTSYAAFLERIHPEDRSRMAALWSQSRLGPQPVSYTYRIVRPDGTIRHLSSKAHVDRDATGKPTRAYGIALDITDLREAELELRRSHAILKAEQEADLDGILVLDETGRVLTFNRRYQELWSLSDAVMATRNADVMLKAICEQVVNPERDIRSQEFLRTDRTARVRTEVALKDGRTFERYTAPVISSQDEHFGRVWFLRDITERKRMEEGLREQNRKLQELDALKSNFVNAISHDLRTPLTSIMGYAEFLEDEVGGSLSETHHEFVSQIQRNANRLERLVDDLLDFARMDAGTFKLALKEADLGALVREVIGSLRPLADEARVAIADRLPPTPLLATFDPSRIERVLMNLIGNALKFTEAGGTVTVSGRVEATRVCLAISDTGIGIAPEDVNKLFQRFSQLSPGMRQANGTGLGLSISKALVDAHGGEIGVSSEQGKGSTFWFSLPRSPDGRGSTDG